MKKVFGILALAGLLLSAQSCKKCGQCESNGTATGLEYCEKDGKDVYDAAKAACEAAGGEWVTK